MLDNKRIVAIIPARGGSKGLPRKNILSLRGKPLIAWSIDQAKASGYIDKIIVSTDDDEIASVAKTYGAEVPFLRPKDLASDSAKTYDVIIHALDWLASSNDLFDIVIVLQPTSPLRTAKDIDDSLRLLLNKQAAGSVVSICETEHHPYWSNVLPSDESLGDFLKPEVINKNRQELPLFYRLNGAIYAARIDYLRAQKGFLGKKAFAYVMTRERSVDIDTKLDFKFAELLLSE